MAHHGDDDAEQHATNEPPPDLSAEGSGSDGDTDSRSHHSDDASLNDCGLHPQGPRIDPAVLAALRRFITTYQRRAEQMLKAVTPQLEVLERNRQSAINAIQSAIASPASQQFIRSAAEAMRKLVTVWQAAMPDNWTDLEPSEQIAAINLIEETGWPLVWVPRAEIVRELLENRDESERGQVLVRRSRMILEDLDEVLVSVACEEMKYLASTLMEAVATYRAGHPQSAQALSAAVLTTLVQHKMTFSKLSDARDQLARALDEVPIPALRYALVASTVPVALRAESMPTSFNRHASLHHVHPTQYTERNSIVALMLAASLIKELDTMMQAMGTDGG